MMTRSEMLKRYGLFAGDFTSVRPERSDNDGLWRVMFSSTGNPATLMFPETADQLLTELRLLGEDLLTSQIADAIEKARRYRA